MKLVGMAKRQLQKMRDGEWKQRLMDDVSSFCVKHDILIPKMDVLYVLPGRSTITYSHHLRVDY